MEEFYVGIDVSKARLDVHVHPTGEVFDVANDETGVEALVSRLQAVSPALIVLEATGRQEVLAAAGLWAAGLPVAIVNAAQVKSFALALNRRAKTDALDAEAIARFAEAVKPAIRPLPDAQTAALEALVTRRRQVLRMRVSEQQRLQQTTDKLMRQSIKRMIEALTLELERLDGEIDKTIRASPVWRVREDLMASVPGVGKLTARTLMAEMPELGSLSPKAAASLAGLAPFTRQSGQWKGRSFTGGGRAGVRTALFMAALSAKKHNPPLAETYNRMLAAGKPKMVALIAVARRLLTILNAIVRDQKPWQIA
jgi:transposase